MSANTVRLEEVEDASRGALGLAGTSTVAVVTVDFAFAGHRDAWHAKVHRGTRVVLCDIECIHTQNYEVVPKP